MAYNPVMAQPMQTLQDGAAQLGVSLSRGQLAQFQVYLRELADGNRQANLTAITDAAEVEAGHFLDSLTLCLAVPPEDLGSCSVIDVGAGAGFPGIPVKLAFPEISLTLADSIAKKTRFLHHLADTLGLTGVYIRTGRAETLAHDSQLRESFDLALARGVAKLPVLLEYTLPFCKIGGRVVAWKRGDIAAEISAAEAAAPVLGGRITAVHPVNLPGLTDNRILVVAEKVDSTPDGYPRRVGIPAKRPIGGRRSNPPR